jgi:stage II sporulation protein D
MLRIYICVLCIIIAFGSGCSSKVRHLVHKAPHIRVHYQGRIISVDLERYVASVLAGEVPSSWPQSALLAQAVAARTFALLRMKERKNQSFHVKSTVLDQVYKENPNPIFINAARATAGQVLFYDNRLAETSYHSTCGGKTADSFSIWGRPYQHLQGVECNYCKSSKTYQWKAQIALQELEAKLQHKVSDITIISRSNDGRAQTLEIKDKDFSTRLSAHELRMTFGPMRMKSTLINSIIIKDNIIYLEGNGFGHGVGMCQYGALGLARINKNYREILSYYYPGTQLRTLY